MKSLRGVPEIHVGEPMQEGPNDPDKTTPPAARVVPVGGGFRLIQRIGGGTFGEVWRALAPGDVEVAIKIILRPISDSDADRERRALELIKKLHHPFLLQMQAFWIWEERLYILMEL